MKIDYINTAEGVYAAPSAELLEITSEGMLCQSKTYGMNWKRFYEELDFEW